LPADMERAFAVSLHSYQVSAHGNTRTYTFHAPLSRPTIPSELATSVSVVAGLDTRPSLRPLYHSASQQIRRAPPAAMPAATGNPLGSLTVADFANDYDVQPLYKRGVTGKGRTLAIATLASFTPSDAFAYWSALKLKVNKNRLKIVNVDGGPGSPSDASGSFETTIDVEQSGGIAPGANIIVYQAPNTNQGFVDLFAAAVDSNAADTISVSWGFWEWYQNLENSPVTDPITGKSVGLLNAFHELFVRAAIQGQTLFAASGDGGAYDANNDFGCSPESTPSCSTPLTVDNPASDTAMTAAGGTTLPGLQEYCLNSACTPPYYDINLTHERVWGWDYLNGYCSAIGVPDPIACGTFPGGSGGGVSIIFAKPVYQYSLPGVQRSQPGQRWIYDGTLTYVLPSNYAGRNVPDISFNADPQTGYVVYYTSDVSGFSVQPYWGGTSFVAPQLNGVSALLGDYLHGSPLGLLNYPLYGLALSGDAYGGPNPPLHPIAYGDNWFYQGTNGYNPGAGLGTLDVANFARVLGNLF
ncbi:MAG: S53 family peptidase, partial [Acidobacteriota bacterium]|nr:S53 family peptidase [Acidobacteriota bacterium]